MTALASRKSWYSFTLAGAIFLSCFDNAIGADGELVVHVGTGDLADAFIAAYVEPFEEETGIDVIPVKGWFSYSELKLWQQSGRSEVDVSFVFYADAALSYKNGWLVPIDYSEYEESMINDLLDSAKQPWGVAAVYYSVALSHYADVAPAPSNWAEFWDVEKFPGKRTLRSGEFGIGGLYEIALLADGVNPDNLYPLDFERAGKSLNKIRDHIEKWWRDGSDLQQLFADRDVAMGPAFDGRMKSLKKKDLDIKINYNQALLFVDYWVIPKGAPNVDAAQEFIRFVSRADRQADSMKRIPYGPSNSAAFEHMTESYGRTLPSHPDVIDDMVVIDGDWYTKTTDGQTNIERAIEYWNAWRLQ